MYLSKDFKHLFASNDAFQFNTLSIKVAKNFGVFI